MLLKGDFFMPFLFVMLQLCFGWMFIQPDSSSEITTPAGDRYYETANLRFEYGSQYYDDGNINGLLTIKDMVTQETLHVVEYDDSELEFFLYLAEVEDESIVIVCAQYLNSGKFTLPEFHQTILLKYDFEGKLLSKITLPNSYDEYHNHNHNLVLVDGFGVMTYVNAELKPMEEPEFKLEYINFYTDQFQGSAYLDGKQVTRLMIDYPGYYQVTIKDGDYQYSYEVTVNPKVTINGEFQEDYYTGDVSVDSIGEIYINSELYKANTVIDTAGFYEGVIYGAGDYQYQFEFQVFPQITYFDGVNYNEFVRGLDVSNSIKISTNGTGVMIDGEAYDFDYITQIGNHNLTIYGLNGFQTTLPFVIHPKVIDLTNEQTYESIEFYVFGTAYLNEKIVSGTVYVDTPGEYKLQLMFENEVYETYSFKISSVEPDQSLKTNFNYLNIIPLFMILLGGYYILRKK